MLGDFIIFVGMMLFEKLKNKTPLKYGTMLIFALNTEISETIITFNSRFICVYGRQ